MEALKPLKRSYLDGPMCVRELKPGVAREGHLLTDHVDYSEEPGDIGRWDDADGVTESRKEGSK